MDITSPPNTLRPVAATIDIPDPAPWTVLEGDANTENYGWRQPRHNAYTSRRGFDDDFARVLSNASGLQFALHFAAAVRAVTELERLADSRQTKFERKPMKDGSNLFGFTPNPLTGEVELNGGEGLRSMYQYMKEVLQMLYRNNLLHISALGQYEPLQQSMLQLQGKSRMAKGRHGFRDPERGQVLCCKQWCYGDRRLKS